MDKLKLRYLIREAIENVVGVSAKFSIGDKVTTVDGDTATVTMAEHPFYTVELEETGTTKSFNFKDLAPFQEKEISKTSEGIMLQEGAIASPGLMFHQQHKKPLSECIFRIGSEAYVDFYAEARELFNEGVLKVNELDRDLIRNTDIGEYGIFEGKKVALDIPFIKEEIKSTLTTEGVWSKGDDTAIRDFILDVEQLKDDYYDIVGSDDVFNGLDAAIRAANDLIAMNEDAQTQQDRKDMGYDLNDLLAVKSDLKKKGFEVKVGYPTEIDPKIQIQYIDGDIDDLQSTLDQMFGDNYRIVFDTNQRMFEAKAKKKKDPPIGKPKRGGSKAYYVYVRDPKTKRIKKVSFGSGGLRAKINNPKARRAFAARHKCSQKTDRTKPSYWSCRLPHYAKALGLGANKNTFW